MVYVILEDWGYDGGDTVAAIYKDKAKAEQACAELNAKKPYYLKYRVEEHECHE
ncbi:hypothetical protein [Nitrospira sp. BLG_2]|uniref:hypothetical protein n=1 Tax=Nitrospira sp. BLG_2 TaxID=3397507 RepID=UPI003B9CE66E